MRKHLLLFWTIKCIILTIICALFTWSDTRFHSYIMYIVCRQCRAGLQNPFNEHSLVPLTIHITYMWYMHLKVIVMFNTQTRRKRAHILPERRRRHLWLLYFIYIHLPWPLPCPVKCMICVKYLCNFYTCDPAKFFGCLGSCWDICKQFGHISVCRTCVGVMSSVKT